MNRKDRCILAGSIGVLALAIVGCSGGNDPASAGGIGVPPVIETPDSPPPAAHLTVRLHDQVGPGLQEAWVTLTRLEARTAEGGWIPTEADLPLSVDLLTLVDGRTVTLTDAPIPEGTYDALALTIESSYVVLDDGSTVNVPLPAGGMTALVPVSFEATAGQPVAITLDFPVHTSFALVRSGVALSPAVAAELVSTP